MSEYLSPNLGLNERVLTVSQLNAQVKKTLTNNFPLVVVEGEISNLSNHYASGHYYFNLKDERAVLRCVMFKSRAAYLQFQPKDGIKVVIRAEISLYERSGQYQAVVQHMEPHGEGELRLAFERLKQKLQALGWFAESRKKPLPEFPKRIVVVSSLRGAATRDVFINIWRRYPPVELTVEPTAVQGQLAESGICAALTKVNDYTDKPDLVILTRGGGSLEDLAAFNSEQVATAIYESIVPVVSAVGHDVDFTIADFVADLRAPTPSTAAELVTPDSRELGIRFDEFVMKFDRSVRAVIGRVKTNTEHLQRRMRDPRREIANNRQRFLDRAKDLRRTQSLYIVKQASELVQLQRALNQARPDVKLAHNGTRLRNVYAQLTKLAGELNKEYSARLDHAVVKMVQLNAHLQERTSTRFLNLQRTLVLARPFLHVQRTRDQVRAAISRLRVRAIERNVSTKNKLNGMFRNLEAVSPLKVLDRGYAVVTKPDGRTQLGAISKSVDDLYTGECIQTHFADGTVYSKVTGTEKKDHRVLLQPNEKHQER